MSGTQFNFVGKITGTIVNSWMPQFNNWKHKNDSEGTAPQTKIEHIVRAISKLSLCWKEI